MELPGDEECSPTGLQDVSVCLALRQCQNLSHHREGLSRLARVREKLGDVEESSPSTPLITFVRCKSERTSVGRERFLRFVQTLQTRSSVGHGRRLELDLTYRLERFFRLLEVPHRAFIESQLMKEVPQIKEGETFEIRKPVSPTECERSPIARGCFTQLPFVLIESGEIVNPNRKIFEARKRETAALGAGEKLVLGHPLAATIGDSARCMQNLEKVLFTGPKTSDTVTFICD